MSGLLTVNGGYNGTYNGGLLPVPTNFTTANGDSSIATALQTYLNGVSTSLQGGLVSTPTSFYNLDVANGLTYSVSGAGAGALVDITDTSSTNVKGSAATTGASVSIPTITSSLVVEDPQRISITGSTSTTVAVFGAQSSVHYSVTGGQGSIYAAGGNDVIGIYSAGTNSNVALVSAGNDSINLNGTGNDTVTAVGDATTNVLVGAADATVSATGSSLVNVVFSQQAGGNVDFINNSTGAGSVYTGSYGPGLFAPNSVTVFAGGGGGIYVGGRAGSNSLTGGNGLATLVGGGNGDILTVSDSVTASGTFNELFTGQGTETLLGLSGSGNNAFNIGLQDIGVGAVTASGIASSNGSGSQNFDIGNTTSETITGSSATGATNFFDVFGDSTTGGGTFTINNFNSTNSAIYLVDNTTQAPGDASISAIGSSFGSAQILLTDGTTITLKGVATSAIATATGSFGEIVIT